MSDYRDNIGTKSQVSIADSMPENGDNRKQNKKQTNDKEKDAKIVIDPNALTNQILNAAVAAGVSLAINKMIGGGE